MNRCKCGSYAINPRLHGRNPNTDLDLCDVCYFKKRLEEAKQRLAEVGAKNIELEKELFVLSSDVIYCGCGHVSAGLQEKAKRIYGKLRESGGEG